LKSQSGVVLGGFGVGDFSRMAVASRGEVHLLRLSRAVRVIGGSAKLQVLSENWRGD
jgi:hypothetical protein